MREKEGKKSLQMRGMGYEEEGGCCVGGKEGRWESFLFFFFACLRASALACWIFFLRLLPSDADTKGYVPRTQSGSGKRFQR